MSIILRQVIACLILGPMKQNLKNFPTLLLISYFILNFTLEDYKMNKGWDSYFSQRVLSTYNRQDPSEIQLILQLSLTPSQHWPLLYDVAGRWIELPLQPNVSFHLFEYHLLYAGIVKKTKLHIYLNLRDLIMSCSHWTIFRIWCIEEMYMLWIKSSCCIFYSTN